MTGAFGGQLTIARLLLGMMAATMTALVLAGQPVDDVVSASVGPAGVLLVLAVRLAACAFGLRRGSRIAYRPSLPGTLCAATDMPHARTVESLPTRTTGVPRLDHLDRLLGYLTVPDQKRSELDGVGIAGRHDNVVRVLLAGERDSGS